ncbi:MAG: NUDIX domain-containing protein [Candidatus Micrarchaeota archaeon]|nr:NUDIX domain-containing protein [Candidatus Micrarchaeota archaeon]
MARWLRVELSEELIDEVDREGNIVAPRPKSLFKERMFMHRVSLVIPMTSEGKFLLSRRSKDKYPYPDTWCCGVGGKSRSGENPEQTAAREMMEEIGKEYPIRKVASFVYDESDYKAIFTIFTTSVPVAAEELTLDPNEIQYSRAFDIAAILRIVKEDPSRFAPTFVVAIKEFSKHYSASGGRQGDLGT